MSSAEGNMLTMRIIKLLGIAGVAVLAAVYIASREQRRDQRALEDRRRLNERLEKERWESEGGASRSGPATPSAVTAH